VTEVKPGTTTGPYTKRPHNGAMQAWIDRLHGYTLIAGLVLVRSRRLREPLMRREFDRQLHETGISAMPVMGALAVLTGASLVNQVMALLGTTNPSAMRWLFYALVFELAPLICALVTVARTSASMASELAVMNLHKEFTALKRWGIVPADHLLLPRVTALALGLPALTILFQLTALISGWLGTALLQNLPFMEVLDVLLDSADATFLLLALAKSGITGLLIGVIATHHGSTAERNTRAMTDCAIHAVGNGLVAVFLVDVVFALLVFLAL